MSISDLTKEINNINTCAELQRTLQKVEAAIANGLAQIAGQNAALAALQALLTPPTADPAKIVTWISGFISQYIGVDIANLEKMIAQTAALNVQLAGLLAALTAKAAQLENCNVLAIPPVKSITTTKINI